VTVTGAVWILPGLDAAWMLSVRRLLAALYPCLVQAFQAHKNDRLATGNVACLDSFTVNEDQIAWQIFQTKQHICDIA